LANGEKHLLVGGELLVPRDLCMAVKATFTARGHLFSAAGDQQISVRYTQISVRDERPASGGHFLLVKALRVVREDSQISVRDYFPASRGHFLVVRAFRVVRENSFTVAEDSQISVGD
jgi:hypothetical protein